MVFSNTVFILLQLLCLNNINKIIIINSIIFHIFDGLNSTMIVKISIISTIVVIFYFLIVLFLFVFSLFLIILFLVLHMCVINK